MLLAVIALPLVARLALLPYYPIPKPSVADEFSHLLIADTFASGRIVNPTHPFPEHFETVYEFQRPVYASIYPPGKGLVMAAGQVVAGHPWWGVWGITALMCGAVYWMLCGWVEPEWALAGALICIARFAMLGSWINGYAGGSEAALGGAIALGALPRLMKSSRGVWGFVLASGLGCVLFVRPFEGLLYAVALGMVLFVWLLRGGWKSSPRPWLSFVIPIASAALVTLGLQSYYNFRVTGNALLMPYQLSQRMYGVPRAFSAEKPGPEPISYKDPAYKDLRDVYEWQYRTRAGYRYRVRQTWSFYIGAALTPALIFLLLTRRTAMQMALSMAWICALVFAGTLFYWYYLEYYLAVLTGACIALAVLGLRELWSWHRLTPALRHALVGAMMLGVLVEVVSERNSDWKPRFFNAYSAERRNLEQHLREIGGRHLVFVHYGPKHNFETEWIFNRANIDAADIVWAREISPTSDADLIHYFAGRSVWTAEVDEKPVRLEQWCCEAVELKSTAPAVSKPAGAH